MDDIISFAPTSAAITVKLDNSFGVGKKWIFNDGTKIITLTANDNAVIRQIYPGSHAEMFCRQATPTTNTHWKSLNRVTSSPADIAADITFSAGFGTLAAKFVSMRRDGKLMYLNGTVRYGTLAASVGTFTMPYSLNVDNTVYTSGTNQPLLGTFYPLRDTSTTVFPAAGVIMYNPGVSQTTIYFSINSGSGGAEQFTQNNATDAFGSDHDAAFSFEAKIYVQEWGEYTG
jgi:hypothetical protein